MSKEREKRLKVIIIDFWTFYMRPYVISIGSQNKNYSFNDWNFEAKRCFDLILLIRRMNVAAIMKINVSDVKSTGKLIFTVKIFFLMKIQSRGGISLSTTHLRLLLIIQLRITEDSKKNLFFYLILIYFFFENYVMMFYKLSTYVMPWKFRLFKRKSSQKGKAVHEFHFRLKLDLHFHFNVTCALLVDLKILDHFDHFLSYFLPFRSGYGPVWPNNSQWQFNRLTNRGQLS